MRSRNSVRGLLGIWVGVLASVLLVTNIAMASAQETPEPVPWNALASEVEGKEISMTLPDGVRLRGTALGVEGNALILDAEHSSDQRPYLRGETEVARSLISDIPDLKVAVLASLVAEVNRLEGRGLLVQTVARPSRQQTRKNWIQRHPKLFGALVGFGVGCPIGAVQVPGGSRDTFFNALDELACPFLGGVGAAVGAAIGAVASR